MVLCAMVGIYRLGSHSVWFDESWSLMIAQPHGAPFWRAWLEIDPNMTLYYLILHFWVQLGSGEVVARALSVVWTVATVPVLYALGRRLLGSTVAWVACLLFSLNAFVVAYAQDARSYSLLAFLVVASTLLFTRAIDRPCPKRWIAYVCVSALAPYAHVFGLLCYLRAPGCRSPSSCPANGHSTTPTGSTWSSDRSMGSTQPWVAQRPILRPLACVW